MEEELVPAREAHRALMRRPNGRYGHGRRYADMYKIADVVLRQHGEYALETPVLEHVEGSGVVISRNRLTRGTYPIRIDKDPHRYVALQESVASRMPRIHLISTTKQNEDYMRSERTRLGAGTMQGSLASFTEDAYMHMEGVPQIDDEHVIAALSVVTYLFKKLRSHQGFGEMPLYVPVRAAEQPPTLPLPYHLAQDVGAVITEFSGFAPSARIVYNAQNDELPRA